MGYLVLLQPKVCVILIATKIKSNEKRFTHDIYLHEQSLASAGVPLMMNKTS
jgi:hypothetical protein